jgi:hypothetical protein
MNESHRRIFRAYAILEHTKRTELSCLQKLYGRISFYQALSDIFRKILRAQACASQSSKQFFLRHVAKNIYLGSLSMYLLQRLG